jgi:hypothetical protein
VASACSASGGLRRRGHVLLTLVLAFLQHGGAVLHGVPAPACGALLADGFRCDGQQDLQMCQIVQRRVWLLLIVGLQPVLQCLRRCWRLQAGQMQLCLRLRGFARAPSCAACWAALWRGVSCWRAA